MALGWLPLQFPCNFWQAKKSRAERGLLVVTTTNMKQKTSCTFFISGVKSAERKKGGVKFVGRFLPYIACGRLLGFGL